MKHKQKPTININDFTSAEINETNLFMVSTYFSDLYYIKSFQDFINIENPNESDNNKYFNWNYGSFLSFLSDYRIIRRVPKDEDNKYRKMLLETVVAWIKKEDEKDVDGLAKRIQNKCICKGNEVSLASKILFVNNPWEILPIDSQVRKVFKIDNIYKEYFDIINEFREKNNKGINSSLKGFENQYQAIENYFKFKNINKLRINRFIDKLFWLKGRNKDIK